MRNNIKTELKLHYNHIHDEIKMENKLISFKDRTTTKDHYETRM